MLAPDYPIRTDRLLLRPFREDDLADLLAYQSRPEVARYLYWEPWDETAARAALERRVRQGTIDGPGQGTSLAVERRDTGTVIGDVLLQWLDGEHRQGETGFVFHPDHQGHGFAREATEEALRLGFDGLGLHRIVGRCDARNTASAALMARLGLRREGHFVQNEYVKGEWTDELVYAVLADEWRKGSRRERSGRHGSGGPE